MISAAIWPWKNNCFGQGCETSWSLYDSGTLNGSFADQNGPERPNRVRIISRIHPRGVIGQLKEYFYNTTTASFTMAANCINRTLLMSNNETIFYIPRRLNNSTVIVYGEAKFQTFINNPDKSRLVVVNPTCNGKYQLFIANNTAEVEELYRQTIIKSNSKIKLNNFHETKKSMKKTYELLQLLHAAAVKTGQMFAAISSNSVNKVRMSKIISE
jgi:hypothetical protein